MVGYLQNTYGQRLWVEGELSTEILEYMVKRMNVPNALAELVEAKNGLGDHRVKIKFPRAI